MTCTHTRKGFVSNQTGGYDPTQPFAWWAVCADPFCIEAAQAWVLKQTGQPGCHQTDKGARAHAAVKKRSST